MPTTTPPVTEAPEKKKRHRPVPLRGWSGAFPVTDNSKGYMLKGIPAGLWRSVSAKCRRDGISRRAVMLQLLTEWVNEEVA